MALLHFAQVEVGAIPAEFRPVVREFLLGYWASLMLDVYLTVGLDIPVLAEEQILCLPLAADVAWIAQAAAGVLDRNEHNTQTIQEKLDGLLARLCTIHSAPELCHVPPTFWQTPVGQMMARARQWVGGELLATMTEAATLPAAAVPVISMDHAAPRRTLPRRRSVPGQ